MEFWIPKGVLIFCSDCYELPSYIEIERWLADTIYTLTVVFPCCFNTQLYICRKRKEKNETGDRILVIRDRFSFGYLYKVTSTVYPFLELPSF